MKDKEKQIEEMIHDLKIAMCSYESCEECPTSWCYAEECATMAICKGYRKIDKDSVVLSREEYNELLARPLEIMGDFVISKTNKKCKYFRVIDYGYRKSNQCFAQKYAPEVNCNGCMSECEKYPKIGEEK